jgi:beta-glucosidase
VFVGLEQAKVPITGALAASGQWQTLAVPLGCFARAGADMKTVARPFALSSAGALQIAISDIRVASAAVPQEKCAW